MNYAKYYRGGSTGRQSHGSGLGSRQYPIADHAAMQANRGGFMSPGQPVQQPYASPGSPGGMQSGNNMYGNNPIRQPSSGGYMDPSKAPVLPGGQISPYVSEIPLYEGRNTGPAWLRNYREAEYRKKKERERMMNSGEMIRDAQYQSPTMRF